MGLNILRGAMFPPLLHGAPNKAELGLNPSTAAHLQVVRSKELLTNSYNFKLLDFLILHWFSILPIEIEFSFFINQRPLFYVRCRVASPKIGRPAP